MPTINSRLYPQQSVFEGDVLPFYSTLVTGLAGTLVKIVTGAANPQNPIGFSNTPVGYNYNTPGVYIYDNRYETKFKVTPTVSGDTSTSAIGFTQWSTLEYDPNGLPLKFNDPRARELGAVVSGESVPIAMKASVFGIWGNYIDQSWGAAQPGNLVVISRSGNGMVAAVDPTDATHYAAVHTGSSTSFIYDPTHVIGKWLTSTPVSSNTGLANEWSSQGGYYLFSYSLTK